MVKEGTHTYYQSLADAVTGEDPADDVQGVLLSIVETVAKETKAKACSLALLTPDRKYLHHVASYGLSEEYIKKGRLAADKSIADALSGTATAVRDAATDSRVQYSQAAQKEGIVSILSVPVNLDGECIGVLRVYTDQARNFTEDDIRFVTTAASMGAHALENAVLSRGFSTRPEPDVFRRQLVELEWGRWPA